MGVEPPFLYNAVKSAGPRSPYRDFDPKAVSRASYQPRAPRPKPDGPLVSFNKHPDSYLIVPYGNINAKPMNPSVKKWVKWMRIFQLVLRCFEILCAIGLLVFLILLRGMDAAAGWIIRIVPGIAILHTVYGVYHLSRKPHGRTPGTSASYMLFAAFFDIAIVPFYAFSALLANTKHDTWKVILENQDLTPTFSQIVFLLAIVGGGLHLVSLADSLYLAVIFHKITKLPPDMNPLEDNLTSRHKRNKSSMSEVTTLGGKEKRMSAFESNRSSGSPYKDLSPPPTVPFFHTRTQSTNSFSTYKSTPPASRDALPESPSRQYQIDSPRSSVTADPKRQSYNYNAPKRGSYTETPLYQNGSTPPRHSVSKTSEAWFTADSLPTPPRHSVSETSEAWFTADSLSKTRGKPSSPKKGTYAPIPLSDDLPNPLGGNPPTPRHNTPYPFRNTESPLSEISGNRVSGDIADQDQQMEFHARYYGDLKPGARRSLWGGGE
ncbi:hypothetical protein LOCC1_G003386 [Lachnellula occidentalis]|uniref:Uncharacterized protein n=1 Tax=Lachnellula occidentalis TaxID=215460 RepID=A0A8H8S4X0_9HELO|nr:hypothetical protein LOCC1_G003386 [Lachnellula occidentalis]